MYYFLQTDEDKSMSVKAPVDETAQVFVLCFELFFIVLFSLLT